MTWVRLDDGIGEHPKIAALSDSALALFVTGLAYCNRNLTDGFIPHQVGLGQLRYCDGNAVPPIRELEGSGLWVPATGGWQVHDYDQFQPSKEQVLAEREAARERMAEVRAKKRGSAADVQANTSGTSDSPVPVPVPPTSTPLRSVSAPKGFEEFWKAYPLKRGKRKAEGKYQTALSRASAAEILAGAKAYAVEVRGREASKIKYPEGWLEGDRWADLATPETPPEPERTYFEAQSVDEEAVAEFAAAAAANPPSWSKRKDPA